MTEVGSAERLEVEAIARRFEGKIAVCAARLEDDGAGAKLEIDADQIFPAASVITIPIALEAFCQAEEGKLALSDRVTLSATDKVVGPGVLASLAEGLAPTIGDLIHLSMAISDFTATNLLVERVGIVAVNARLGGLGIAHTRLSGKLFVEESKNGPPENEDFGARASIVSYSGDDGRGERSPVTAGEIVRLLSCVYRHENLPANACDALLAALSKSQTASSIRRGLPESRFRDRTPAKLHYKTGAIRGVVNDVGIVATERGAYAIALLSKGSRDLRPTQDNIARVAFAEASRVIYKGMRVG